MSATEEATVNPDGSTTFETPGAGGEGEQFQDDAGLPPVEEVMEEIVKKTDPAVYLLLAVVVVGFLYFFFVFRKKSDEDEDDFFSNLDGDKFNLKLPAEVDEYYTIKEKCESAGWEPGQAADKSATNQNSPHRIMAQALMKRAIADLPIVQHIQKESTGMNKLYSQSMCSVNQWRAYQMAEALVSSEVEEVRAEADEIEPGWSQSIWRQAMQYHNMLKQKHEAEAKAAAEHAQKRKLVEDKVNAAKKVIDDADAKVKASEQAAKDLYSAEERDTQSKQSFKSGTIKKGFLDTAAKGSPKKK